MFNKLNIVSKRVLWSNQLRCFTKSSTIDDKQYSHFKNLAEEWWDLHGDMKALHTMNELRIPFVRDNLIKMGKVNTENINTPHVLRGLKILDVGCGGGILTEPLSKLGCEITGIDVIEDLIHVARRHADDTNVESNLNYEVVSLKEHSLAMSGKYDVVIASEVIEHVSDKGEFIAECVNCLKPNGSVFITTINKSILSGVFAIMIPEYLVRVMAKGTHEYDLLVEPNVVKRLLQENNCVTKIVHGMFYNYFKNYWFWISKPMVFYALHAVKL